MSDGISDMHREEERKAAELVEKECENCIYGENEGCLRCSGYLGMAMFTPSQSAIDAKVEELRKEQIIEGSKEKINRVEGILSSPWEALDRVEKLEQDNAEMLEVLKGLVKWGKDYPSSTIYCESAIKKIAKEIDAICEDAAKLIEKAEGK